MKITIIGAGIGGLTLALALQKHGLNAHVYEAAPELKPVGAGLWLAPNGQAILRAIDPALLAAIQAQNLALQEGRVATLRGQILTRFRSAELQARYQAPLLALRRAHLHTALLEHLAPGTLHLGKAYAASSPSDQQVQVTFADGTALTTDLLVGADGLRSRVRTQHWGEIPLRYSGQTCWRGLATLKLPEPYAHCSYELWGDRPGLRAGFSLVDAHTVYYYLTDAVPAGGSPAADERSLLQQRFAAFPEVVSQMLAATPQESLMRHDLYDFVPLKHYVQGAVALLGDAAHATTPNLGQGANQAMESAWILAQELARQPSLELALAAYQARRQPRAAQLVNTAWRLGQVVNMPRLPRRGVEWLMAHLPPAVQQRQMDAIFAFQPF